MFDVIERLKAEWTDKYVVVASPAPELARFARATGTVRTVNMNGRCLVEFDQFNNIGWYDIDPSHLKIVTEPLPKAEKPAQAKKAAKPAAAAKKPAAKAATGKRPSTADILAAARGGAKPAAKPAGKPAGKLSTAEILAQARAGKAAAAATAEPASEPVAAEPEPPAVEEPAVEPAAATPAADLPTTTAEKIAWCRQHDAK
jgi:hypothetical protein